MDPCDRNSLIIMNRFFTLLLAASCLTAVGQNTNYIFDSQLEDQGWELLLERQGQQYWLLDQDYTWEESMAICTSLGGYLYWPNSSPEHFDVWSQVEHGVDSVQYWTGIHQDFELVDCNSGGGWVGPDGTPQQFFDWYPGEPSNYNGGESVVQFEWGPVGIQWNDAPGQQCDSLNQDPYNIRESRIIMERSKDAGCTDSTAWNYDEMATIDDGSCLLGSSFCGPGTIWDAALQMCIGDGSGDINLDGCVQLNDLLDLLSAYGDCGAEESAWQCGDPLEYQGYDYETVEIGEQCWFAENLRAENYRNGDSIPSSVSNSVWQEIDEGCVSVFGESMDCEEWAPFIDACDPSVSLGTYGRLYNWYAVNDDRGLCASGWHVPSDAEWISLELGLGMLPEESILTDDYRGMNQGIQMKLYDGWDASETAGTNSSNFSGLPGGYRSVSGLFWDAGRNGYFWSATIQGIDQAYFRNLTYDRAGVYRAATNAEYGFSVRCIKD